MKDTTLCKCGHSWALHQHHRNGTDCGSSPCDCRVFRRIRRSLLVGKGTHKKW